MRILWVSSSAGNYHNITLKGSGGWIGSMQEALCEAEPTIEIGYTFLTSENISEKKNGNVTYMPVSYHLGRNTLEKLYVRNFRNEDKYLACCLQEMAEKIRTYKPDIVHVWGIEHPHSGIVEYINDIPVVVHIQGFMTEIFRSFLPPCLTPEDIKKYDSWISRNVLHNGHWFYYKMAAWRAKNEKMWAPKVKNWIGRTDWDHANSQLLSPHSKYFHCEELMRDSFSAETWNYHYDGKTIHIMSVISSEWYKGMDLVLQTAMLLQDEGFSIEWDIYGLSANDPKLHVIANKLKIQLSEVNVVWHGKVSGESLAQALLATDVFVHPSHIENSCNAIAEAQMLGVPVIAQYVGGNPSMLRDGSGLLVAPNEPYLMASAIMQMRDKCIVEELSANALNVARLRQNKDRTISNLLDIYKQLIKEGE